jgi:hypothetical protein
MDHMGHGVFVFFTKQKGRDWDFGGRLGTYRPGKKQTKKSKGEVTQ